MTIFLRLLDEKEKADGVLTMCHSLRNEEKSPHLFEVAPESFQNVPGAPFAYWVSDAVRRMFKDLPSFENDGLTIKQGLATADDFRFVRTWWEISASGSDCWRGFAKGGAFSTFYSDVYLVVNWVDGGDEIRNNLNDNGGVRSNIWMLRETASNFFFRPGLTWPRRTQSGLGMRVMPTGCVFADKGPAIFTKKDAANDLLAHLAITTSSAFRQLVELQMAFGSYEVGVLQRTPMPALSSDKLLALVTHARFSWSLKRSIDTVNETSHAFLLPLDLRLRIGSFDPISIKDELAHIQVEIDNIAFELYGFSEADRATVMKLSKCDEVVVKKDYDEAGSVSNVPINSQDSLLSWCVGVAFGRFDWRLATGKRECPPEPGPFDPLPAKSPGMLPDNVAPFHINDGLLVDDPGHPFDIVRLVEDILGRIDIPTPENLRRWFQRDLFAYHLKQYSQSRRKASIYWPLSTASGNYTLWIYYPRLTNQTLYTAVNDFIEPKLDEISGELSSLITKGGQRSKAEDKILEKLQDLEDELIEMRDSILAIAQNYSPNHDDGVQITAAPLWQLFRHKAWQKVLKETWKKLEKGDYDWTHLSMNYWPDRVCGKCKKDKSLAIAHGLEELFED